MVLYCTLKIGTETHFKEVIGVLISFVPPETLSQVGWTPVSYLA